MKDLFDFEKNSSYDYPRTMTEIDKMKGTQFEYFMFRYLKEFGDFDDVQYTKPMDYGLDVVVDNVINGQERRYGLQCKRYGPNTKLEQNELIKMQVGVKNHAISKRENGKPYLIVYTTATEEQVTGRAREYIDNNEIKVYYRDTIIEILKQINDKLNRDTSHKDYENIAYLSTRQSKGSFKQNSKLVEFLKEERKKIAKFNNIDKMYFVFTDKTIGEIIEKKPTNLNDLKNIKGLTNKNIELFGEYLIAKLNSFYKYEFPDLHSEEKENFNSFIKKKNHDSDTIKPDQLSEHLKNVRKRISDYNNLKPVYHVFNNETLDEIVKIKPQNIEDLMKIKGIGEKKCELFGEYLISEITKFLNK